MRPLSANEEAYEDASTRWAEAGNPAEEFPDFPTWVHANDEARLHNLIP